MAGNELMPEMHLEQQGFTYSVCGSFTKNKDLCKQKIQIIFTRMILLRLVSTWYGLCQI